jgi:hypothetical protein
MSALPLAACGRGGDDELMRRVAQADAAATRAEAAAKRAEQAAARAGSTSASSSDTAVVVEDDNTPYGQGTEPEPMITG